MKQLTGNEVRKMFLDFFESKGHVIDHDVTFNETQIFYADAW